jgi:hypothetical protein
MVNARSDFANSPVSGRLVGTIVQVVDAIAVSPNYAKERTAPVACMRIMKSPEISLAFARSGQWLSRATFHIRTSQLAGFAAVCSGREWDLSTTLIPRGETSSGRSARMRSPRLMLRLAKSPSPISGVDLTSYKSGRLRFRDASWVTWGVEDFSFCRTIDDPFALGLVVRNGLGYGGDD